MRKLPALAAAAASAFLLAGCGIFPDNGQSSGPDNAGQDEELEQPTTDPDDDFQALHVNMVAQSGTYLPDDIDGMTFGCSDTLVTVGTVPVQAETMDEHVSNAMEFLLNDSQYYHGEPSVTNSLTLSETLELDAVEVERDTVTVELNGEVVAQGECEAYRIQAQMYGTAALTSGIEEVNITVDGTELDEVLGLEPFDTSQLFTADQQN